MRAKKLATLLLSLTLSAPAAIAAPAAAAVSSSTSSYSLGQNNCFWTVADPMFWGRSTSGQDTQSKWRYADSVAATQRALNRHGWRLSVDGKFG